SRNTTCHTPEKSVGIEAPPVPFKKIGCYVAAIQAAHYPLQHTVYIFCKETKYDADSNHYHTYQVVGANNIPVAGLRINIPEINIVDDIGLCRIQRTGKRTHKS